MIALTRETRLALLVGSVPLIALGLFYVHVVTVRITLGHWPSYGNPDPAQLPTSLIPLDVAVTWLLIAVWASPVWVVPLLLASLHPRLRFLQAPVSAFSVAWCLVAGTTYLDPGGFFEWLMD